MVRITGIAIALVTAPIQQIIQQEASESLCNFGLPEIVLPIVSTVVPIVCQSRRISIPLLYWH